MKRIKLGFPANLGGRRTEDKIANRGNAERNGNRDEGNDTDNKD